MSSEDEADGNEKYSQRYELSKLQESHDELLRVVENHTDVLVAMQDTLKAMSEKLDTAVRVWTARDSTIEKAILELVAVIGEPPDQSTGKYGTGIRGQLVVAINAVSRAGMRIDHPNMPPQPDIPEESEITGVQDRHVLVARIRAAEFGKKELAAQVEAINQERLLEVEEVRHRHAIELRRVTLAAYGGVIVGIIGALAAAAQALLHVV